MTGPDRRFLAFSGRVALDSLRGRVAADAFVRGEAARVAAPVADLCPRPGAPRDRQVLWGDPLTVIDRDGGQVFVQAAKDGYCGWLDAAAVGPNYAPTHRVAVRASHLYPAPQVRAAPCHVLPHGARLAVLGTAGDWAETPQGFVPAAHLAPWGAWATGPVAAAAAFLGTPYLWGGNTGEGIDCSGLVQAAYHAAGLAMPPDSDVQARAGRLVPDGESLRPGDLVFWTGHVALVTGPDAILHATAHGMTTKAEALSDAAARIAAAGGGPVTARIRPAAIPIGPA